MSKTSPIRIGYHEKSGGLIEYGGDGGDGHLILVAPSLQVKI